MRICVSSVAGTGKSTFVKDFVKNWPDYKSSGNTYRDLIKEKSLNLNKEGNKVSQEIILNCLLDEAMKYTKEDNVIHDRGTIDNLVYTLWLKAKNKGEIDDNFLQKTFQLVKQSMFFYDVIFYIPYDDETVVKEERENRETDKLYNSELDNFFKGVNSMYYDKNVNLFPFNDDNGVPALIEIFGNRQERIEIAKLYINPEGKEYGDSDSLIANFIS
jgi:predicted ATPase